MPDFVTAFTGMAADRKLSPEELVRAIRFMVAAEYEAVQLYVQLAESIDNELAARVLKDIADEELVHAGEIGSEKHGKNLRSLINTNEQL